MEEVIYRLFAINVFWEGVHAVFPRLGKPALLAVGIGASSLLSGAIPTHDWLTALVVGVILGWLYHKRGLVHVLIAHVAGDILVLSVIAFWR